MHRMQNLIDLCSPEKSADSDSEFVPRVTPIKSHSFSHVRNYIKSGIVRRESKRLKKLQAKKLLTAGAVDAAVPQKASQKKVKEVRKKKTTKKQQQRQPEEQSPKRQKTTKCSTTWSTPTNTAKCSTPLATATTATPLAMATTTPLATATEIQTATPCSRETVTLTTPHVPAAPSRIPVANARYIESVPFFPEAEFWRLPPKEACMMERIMLNPCNSILDPSECSCKNCPYSTGLLSSQRFLLMRRAWQIKCTLINNPHLRDEYCD